MPEPIAPSSLEDELMISPLPAPRNARWWAQRSLEGVGRTLVGALICALALGVSILFILFWTYGLFGWFFQLIASLLSPFVQPGH
jgi:hypothetical protein